MADCDSVSLTRVKPAVRCAKRPAPASVVGDQLQQERARGRRGSSSHVCTCSASGESRKRRRPRCQSVSARAYMRVEGGRICQVLKNTKLVAKLLEAIFSYFAKFKMPTSFSKLLEML